MAKPIRDVWLLEGPHDKERLPLMSSKHATITLSDGTKYFRMDATFHPHGDGTEAQCYLWTDYWSTRMTKEKTDG
jgi:hypothetical protein